MTAIAHFNQGDLDAAVDAATQDVKADPTSAIPRVILAEMLCFAGDWERADTILEAAGVIEPAAGVGISQFRFLIQAEAARRDFYTHGQMPTFLSDAGDAAKQRLAAALLIREGDLTTAAEVLGEMETQRAAVPGKHGDDAFTDFRDGDDLLGDFVEVLSPDGRYFWIATSEVRSMQFEPPGRPLDLLFRQATLVTVKAQGEVFIPVLYAGVEAAEADLRLGRATDWRGNADEPVRGVGQRVFFADETELPVLELTSLSFDTGEDD
ncbi:type VI secretion system accessory protein TagJ [Phycisphaeraceae bacterium D3-23]